MSTKQNKDIISLHKASLKILCKLHKDSLNKISSSSSLIPTETTTTATTATTATTTTAKTTRANSLPPGLVKYYITSVKGSINL